jgi:hypothetical protein
VLRDGVEATPAPSERKTKKSRRPADDAVEAVLGRTPGPAQLPIVHSDNEQDETNVEHAVDDTVSSPYHPAEPTNKQGEAGPASTPPTPIVQLDFDESPSKSMYASQGDSMETAIVLESPGPASSAECYDDDKGTPTATTEVAADQHGSESEEGMQSFATPLLSPMSMQASPAVAPRRDPDSAQSANPLHSAEEQCLHALAGTSILGQRRSIVTEEAHIAVSALAGIERFDRTDADESVGTNTIASLAEDLMNQANDQQATHVHRTASPPRNLQSEGVHTAPAAQTTPYSTLLTASPGGPASTTPMLSAFVSVRRRGRGGRDRSRASEAPLASSLFGSPAVEAVLSPLVKQTDFQRMPSPAITSVRDTTRPVAAEEEVGGQIDKENATSAALVCEQHKLEVRLCVCLCVYIYDVCVCVCV